MNKRMLQELVGRRVLLWPIAWEVDDRGERVGFRDDLWNVGSADEKGLVLVSNHDMTVLGLRHDVVQNFQSAERADGYLCLRGQIYIQGKRAWVAPGPYPGKAPVSEPEDRGPRGRLLSSTGGMHRVPTRSEILRRFR